MAKEKDIQTDSQDTKQETVMYGGMNDGNMLVSFSENNLAAYADFVPPVLNGKPLDNERITRILDSINVVYGVSWDAINKALEECNTYRAHINVILIAKGQDPVPQITEYYKLNPKLHKIKRVYDPKERINYREHSPFVIVKKGQMLAKLRPLRPGKEGTNVLGGLIPYNIISPVGVSGGDNTLIEADKIVAAIDGQFIDAKGLLSVQENLIIKGAVGYRTGHITFPGDVRIDGSVSDGFKIYCGGSLTIKQTLDLTEVVTKGDIVVSGGIIGKSPALIKSGGGIRTKFIENCRVASRHAVLVESEIINSNIFTLDIVKMSDKGRILGGEIYSVHGVRAGAIGVKGGKTTRIHCGIDFAVQQEKEKYTNQLRMLSAKLLRLKDLMEDPGTTAENMSKMNELRCRLQEEQNAASARVSELIGNINTNESAVVEVLGEIAQGTLIEICQVALFIEEPLRKVRVRLDKGSGKLVNEPL